MKKRRDVHIAYGEKIAVFSYSIKLRQSTFREF